MNHFLNLYTQRMLENGCGINHKSSNFQLQDHVHIPIHDKGIIARQKSGIILSNAM